MICQINTKIIFKRKLRKYFLLRDYFKCLNLNFFLCFFLNRLEKRQLEHEEIWRKLEDLHLKHTQKQLQDSNKPMSTMAKRK